MNYGLSIIVPCVIAFAVTYLATKKFIPFLNLAGIVGTDIQKKNKPKIPEMGSPPVLLGFVAGIFAYIFAQTFIIQAMSVNELLILMAAITTLVLIAFIGMIDELTCLLKDEKKKMMMFGTYKKRGIELYSHLILPLFATLPLIAISAGVSFMHVPFLGMIEFGILYPLIIVPIAILGAANATNMLAGFNGLQAGLGIVLLSFSGVYALMIGSFGAALIAFTISATLVAFLFFNWYPAKIFPGGLDYLVGAAIATVAIVGNMERFAFLCFLPWFIELFLKLRSGVKAENFGILQKDGTLKAPYEKTYSLTHAVMKLGKFNEKRVTSILILCVAAWCCFVFVLNVMFL